MSFVWSNQRGTVTCLDLLERAAHESADQPFVDFSGDAATYAEVWERSARFVSMLRDLGVGRGDTVAVMLDNNLDNLCSWYGANLAGAVWVGINTALRGSFLSHVLNDSGAKVVLCEADYVERLRFVGSDLAAAPVVLARGDAAVHDAVPLGGAFDAASVATSLHRPLPGDVSLLIYTGGTTGPSKGCMNSFGYVMNLGERYIESTGRRPGELNWSPLPMYHFNVLSLTITSTLMQRSTASIAPRFSVSQFWPEMERTGARIVNLLGSMGTMIARADDSEVAQRLHGQVRFVHGAPFSPEVQGLWKDRFGIEEIGGGIYGLTEAVPLTMLAAGTPAPAGSSGRRNDADFDVRIFDDDDCELPDGEVGEIVARPKRPDVMFQGYWRRPEATAGATRNLWFHTGDLGRFDENGFFFFVDRKKDYLRRRGENISSMELESTYLGHPDIEQVAAHAVPSDVSEDDVKITAVRKPGATLEAKDLFEWSLERIPYFALPRYIEFRDSLPVSAVGRVHKFQLRDEGVTATTWDRDRADVAWKRR